MKAGRAARFGIGLALVLALGACGGSSSSSLNPFKRRAPDPTQAAPDIPSADRDERRRAKEGTIWDLFSKGGNPNTSMKVNKYIWTAALDVLNFLPVESVDPFTGVIVTGYGTPPGGGRAYRATIYVSDPALDARSLNVSLMTKAGPASPDTVHAIEDAILTRARQLRIRDGKL